MAGGNTEDETWGAWEDDFDDDFDEAILQATQVAEEEERQLQQLRNQSGARGSGGPSLTPNLAAQVFNSRRENLHQDRHSDPDHHRISDHAYEDSPSQVQYLNKQFAIEKSKNLQLTNDLLAAQGETCNLRRQVETLKQTQQEELVIRLKREREEKQKYEEDKRELYRELSALKTELRSVRNDNVNLKSKQAMVNVANRSIGGALSQHPAKSAYSPTASKSMPSTGPMRPRSDPNLRTPQQQRLKQVPQPVIPVSPEQEAREDKEPPVEHGVQADIVTIQQEIRDKELFLITEDGVSRINIAKLEDVAESREVAVRREIFQRMQRIIQLNLRHAKSEIESIVARAPKEIMARFTRGVEMKTCFPDLIENMFLYGVQFKQRKDRELRNERVQKKYPKLQSMLNPPIINLNSFYDVLENSFVYTSVLQALTEVKEQLKKLLSGLVGDLRFRLYELPNLQALWELLSWAKHLWQFLLFEEDFKDVVDYHGKEVWIAELKSWTGLVLKIDWRDFFMAEVEQLVRGFSLSILEIIVTTGYFDSSQRRYEILYCILKDTLLKDHLCTEPLVRRCLKIITWSITDNRNILNYLCINNNDGNCLARILGDNVLKCFKETENPQSATTLLLHYFHLLESLMLKRPPHSLSTIACSRRGGDGLGANDIDSESEDTEDDEDDEDEDDSEGAGMEVDMMCSQFACTEKYKFEDGSSQRAKKFNKVKSAPCWINPVEWEIPMGAPTVQDVCQCRKILLGSAFIMLHRVVEWWKGSILTREKNVEARESMKDVELQELKEEPHGSDEERQKEIASQWETQESLRKFIIAFSNEPVVDEELANSEERLTLQPTSDVMLDKWDPPVKPGPKSCGYDRKQVPTTLFDLAVCSGALLMNFCNFHSENIALAAGSEAFNAFTVLTSETKEFDYRPCMTAAEKRLLMEILKSGEDLGGDMEEEDGTCHSTQGYSSTDDDGDDEANSNSCTFAVVEDSPVTLNLQGDLWADDKKSWNEVEFDRACQSQETRMSFFT